MARKTAFIIGNGSLEHDLSGAIDNADFVMRFNEPNLADDKSGSRTDVLMLAASSKALHLRMADPAFLENAALKSAKILMLAYHPEVIRKYHPRPNIFQRLRGRRADWTTQAIELMGHAGKEIRIMPPQFYADGCAELGIAASRMRKVFPSTGFLGIRYALANLPTSEWQISLCGFGWQGWKRHDWQNERSWVESKIASGLIGMAA
ncbi:MULTISPECIES: glycosyltransferase family 29 protein [unclassified Rhizobium]|uniref:glycosyltransferase family 29 protein n=1 Tax=unclassified Rhizobium TaxID=2613769 RepID=UPI0037FAB776